MNHTPDANALVSRFHALDIALELIRRLKPIIAKIRRYDRNEADQLQRAANSIARNLSEGRRRLGADRRNLWSYASGSTDEAHTTVLIAHANARIDDADYDSVRDLFDRELAITWQLTH